MAGEKLAEVVERLRPEVDALREERPEDSPSFFDATTAAALAAVRGRRGRSRGAGGGSGRAPGLDEHRDSCGGLCDEHRARTHREAGHEPGGDRRREGRHRQARRAPGHGGSAGRGGDGGRGARRRGSAVPWPDTGASSAPRSWTRISTVSSIRFRDGSLVFEAQLAVAGAHQARNAALALACVRRLGAIPDRALGAAARRAFAAASLPARIEFLSHRPWLVVDGAHTAASAAALARTLARIPRRRGHLVLSVSAGKDLAAICRSLVPFADQLTITRAEPVRSLAARGDDCGRAQRRGRSSRRGWCRIRSSRFARRTRGSGRRICSVPRAPCTSLELRGACCWTSAAPDR